MLEHSDEYSDSQFEEDSENLDLDTDEVELDDEETPEDGIVGEDTPLLDIQKDLSSDNMFQKTLSISGMRDFPDARPSDHVHDATPPAKVEEKFYKENFRIWYEFWSKSLQNSSFAMKFRAKSI